MAQETPVVPFLLPNSGTGGGGIASDPLYGPMLGIAMGLGLLAIFWIILMTFFAWRER